MHKKILFVTANQGFLVKAMLKNLNDGGFETRTAEPDIVEIQLLQEELPDIFMVYLEGDINSFNGTLKYLKKLITEEGSEHPLYLIGSQIELDVAFEVIPKTLVTEWFIRPVNMKDVLARLNTLFFHSEDGSVNHRKSILVVDDEEIMLRTMNTWLSKKYDVYLANSGVNAISCLSQKHVDLILLDYEMPVASGLQVFEMIKGEPRTANIPIIFLTAKDDKETVLKVLAAKPEKYLLKTMEPEALVRSIDDFFKGK